MLRAKLLLERLKTEANKTEAMNTREAWKRNNVKRPS